MKLRVKNTLLIGVAFLSITVLWQAYNWLVPMYLDGYLRGVFGGNEFLIGLVMGADNLFAVFMIPWIGKISDRQKRETGSRMKLIVWGLVFAGISFLILPFTKDNIFLMILTLFAVLTAMNVYRAPAVSLMPDITPKPLRSKANALINIMGGIGTGIGYILLLVGGVLGVESGFIVIGVVAVMFVCLAVLMTKVDEKQFAIDLAADLEEYRKNGIDTEAQDEMLNCGGSVQKKNLILVLLAVFFYFMATNSVETFMSLYSGQVLNDTNAGLILFGVLALGSFVFLYPSAVFADKYGFRNAMLLGACLMAGANVFIAFFTCYSHLLIPAFFICGAGMAFMISNMYPLVVGFCDRDNFAKYTGYYYAATMTAQAVTPVFAGLLFSNWVFGTMKALMPYSAVFMVFSAATLFMVKPQQKNGQTAVF